MSSEAIRTRICLEEPEADNPFASRTFSCHGYDVFGDMVGKARWVDMLYLLFRGAAPPPPEADLLEALAVALANPGPRDPSVHAAMCGGTCGSVAAASLMAALAVGAGQLSGAREVHFCVVRWAECGTDIGAWRRSLGTPPAPSEASVWPDSAHVPGFDPHGRRTAGTVLQALAALADLACGPRLPWLAGHREELESAAGLPLSLSGIAAAAYADLGFSPAQAEMLHLLLRLPGAAAHALEQQEFGHKKFPFGEIEFDSAQRQEEPRP